MARIGTKAPDWVVLLPKTERTECMPFHVGKPEECICKEGSYPRHNARPLKDILVICVVVEAVPSDGTETVAFAFKTALRVRLEIARDTHGTRAGERPPNDLDPLK